MTSTPPPRPPSSPPRPPSSSSRPPSSATRRREHRRLAVLVLAALAGAGCCAGASATPWWTRSFDDPLAGTVHIVAHGSDLLGGLVPIALVALAGLGATFATRGLVRRAVGVLLVLAGILVVIRCAVDLGSAPTDWLTAQLQRPATPAGPPDLTVAGPILALAGGALIALAGILVVTGADRARRMGSAYDAPARRREQALQRASAAAGAGSAGGPGGPGGAGGVGNTGGPDAAGPEDPGEWWRALDVGADPTDPGGIPLTSNAGGVPGQEHLSEPDTMSAPDGHDDAESGRTDPTDRSGRRDGSARSRPRRDEETTG